MTKRKIKRQNITKRRKGSVKTRKYKRTMITKKNRKGGEPTASVIASEQEKKTLFRRYLNDLIIEISDKNKSKNKIKETITKFLKFFTENDMINTLIPVSESGKYVDKESGTKPIVDLYLLSRLF